ncbi:hypothetical protein FJ444_00195 [Aestuariibacter sp. GS-14]|uniref:maltose acetyltransferase domain-containing protein n=1 Tax=Aestuariibacter sp. GS-14 TaxID=2590670 RepID=UPI0011294967|nr:maltose acetyltransferase domain-containing protein [Aestuariibacter sp. GS-14]TPV61732.1 hypothetical protein FJ444_00195 [Aestuariibacter sp. GS-14]
MVTSSDVWQVMQNGDWYLAHSPALLTLRERAAQLCWLINQPNHNKQVRKDAIQQLLPHAVNVEIGERFACDFGVNIVCNGPLIIKNNVVILDHNTVTLGASVVIEDGVVIATVTHPIEEQKRKAGWQQAHAIHIGNNVTLGARCSVLPGATIPDDTQVLPETVVTASTFAI